MGRGDLARLCRFPLPSRESPRASSYRYSQSPTYNRDSSLKTPRSFAEALAQTRLPSVFNPYADCCPTHDRADAARVRRRNLMRCLDAALAAHVDTIWIARDLGYRG